MSLSGVAPESTDFAIADGFSVVLNCLALAGRSALDSRGAATGKTGQMLSTEGNFTSFEGNPCSPDQSIHIGAGPTKYDIPSDCRTALWSQIGRTSRYRAVLVRILVLYRTGPRYEPLEPSLEFVNFSCPH